MRVNYRLGYSANDFVNILQFVFKGEQSVIPQIHVCVATPVTSADIEWVSEAFEI